jgi:hypothetical protein
MFDAADFSDQALKGLGAFAGTRQAFARLLKLAEERDSGQIQRIERFLAATYNGQAFQLNEEGTAFIAETEAAAEPQGLPWRGRRRSGDAPIDLRLG